MNDKQIHSFMLIANEKSFNKAADKAYVSVQALKKQIDSLEDELNARLFIRSNQGCVLTSAGRKFYEGLSSLIPKFEKKRLLKFVFLPMFLYPMWKKYVQLLKRSIPM